MPAHVKSISYTAFQSTHTALQLNQSQSPLLSCCLLRIHLNTGNSINQQYNYQSFSRPFFFLLCPSLVNFPQHGIEKMKVKVDKFFNFLAKNLVFCPFIFFLTNDSTFHDVCFQKSSWMYCNRLWFGGKCANQVKFKPFYRRTNANLQ